MSYQKRSYILIILLLCGLSLHYMFITILMNDAFYLKFWKEIVLFLLVCDTLLNNNMKSSSQLIDMKLDYTSLAFHFFTCTLLFSGIFMTGDFSKAVFVIRRYFIPFFVYYIAKQNKSFNKEFLYKIIRSVIYFYILIAIWGIFQAIVLGDNFLINLGYPLKYGIRLTDSYYFGGAKGMQRVVSTFTNTNVYASVNGFLLLILFFNPDLSKTIKHKNIILFVLLVAFLLSFSRSNWLALGIVIIIAFRKTKYLRKVVSYSSLLMVSFIPLLSIITQSNYINIFVTYISETISMEDTSAAARSGIWLDGFKVFLSNPFGIGLGNVGVISRQFNNGEIVVNGESSYLALLLDNGIHGAFFFITIFISLLYYNRKYKNEYKNTVAIDFLNTVKYMLIYLMVMFIFSNHIYDLEMMIFVFFFLGASKNKNLLISLNEINLTHHKPNNRFLLQ